MLNRWSSLFILGLCWCASALATSQSGITYQGRILKPDGSPLAGANVQFKLQIRTPNSSDCLMYEEIQALDMRNSNGVFGLTINDGTGSRTDTTTLGLDRIFANYGSFTFNPATCASGSSYTPSAQDGRRLAVLFKDETMSTWEPIPAQTINYVPYAIQSGAVQGYGPDSLVRVVNGSGDPITGLSPLSNAQYTELLALANGTSTNYTKSGQLNGSALPAMNSGEVLGWNGSAWVSTTSTPGANSITSTMIQSGAVTTSQIANNVSINTSGTVASAVTTTRDFKIYATSPSTYYIDMQAPALSASYNLVWPMNAGSANQVLTTDGAGNLTWAAPAVSSQWTNHATNISYDGTGNVGIGTTSPSLGAFEVRKGIGSVAGFFSKDASSSGVALGTSGGGTAAIQGFTAGGVDAPLSLQANGVQNVGIGFSGIPLSRLDVNGGVAVGSYAGTAAAPANGMIISGNVGIGTTSPSMALNVNGGILAQSLSPSVDQSLNGLTVYPVINVTANNGVGTTGVLSFPTIAVAAGVTGTGAYNGGSFYAYRNFNTAAVDSGTLPTVQGVAVNYGHYNFNGGATPTTTNAYGVAIRPVAKSGTIGNMYDLYLETAIPGGTITGTHYGVYQKDSAIPNSFAGSVGIGTTSPSALLDVNGAIRVAGSGSETCDATHYVGGIRYNGGNLQFCNGTTWSTLGVAGSGITALTGDVTASGTGSVAATVASVGGSTAANVHAAELLANAATNANTASAIVKRDASGNFAAGTATLTSANVSSVVYKDSGSNTVTVSAPTAVTTSYGLKWPTAVAASSGQVLASDTSGNLSWSSIPTSLPPSGSAGGDLSGTYPNPTVATVGTSTAANIHSAEVLANAATALNTSGALVLRDGSGNFAANMATVNGVALNNAGSVLNIVNPIGGAWTMTLPATAGSSGQVMQTNGSGTMSWVTPLTSTTGFINGGNSFGANSNLGNNDNFDINIKTNNATRMTVTAAGSVGIGTTAPSTALDVRGTVTAQSFQQTIAGASPSVFQTFTYFNSYSNGAYTPTGTSNLTPPGMVASFHNTDGTDGTAGGVVFSNANASGYLGLLKESANTGSIVLGNSTGASAWSERMRISSAGNVGIGTTSPTSMLDVAGTASFARATSGPSAKISSGDATWGDGALDLITAGTGHSTRVNFSYNSTPRTWFMDSGANFYLYSMSGNQGTGTQYTVFNVDKTTGNLLLNTAGGGKVGIGTTSPGYTLDVNGAINATAVKINGVDVTAGNPTSSTSSVTFNSNSDATGTDGGFNFQANGSNLMTISNSGDVAITSSTASSNTTTGALVVSGGIGAAGNVNSGGTIQGVDLVAQKSDSTVYAPSSSSVGTPVTGVYSRIYNSSQTDGAAAYISLKNRNALSAGTQEAYIASVSNSGAGTYTPSIVIGQQTGATAYSERMRIDANGNVGIGTSSPTAALDLAGGSINMLLGSDNLATTRTNNTIKVARIGTYPYTNTDLPTSVIMSQSSSAGSGQVYLGGGSSYMNAATQLSFYTGAASTATGTERMRIDSSGNVGIGTTAPSNLLTVYKSGSGYPVSVSGNGGTGPGGYINLAINNTASGGYKGGVEFQNNGTAKFSFGVDYLGNGSNNFSLFDNVAGSIRMYIDPSGNVGIGTTAPAQPLEIYSNTADTGLRLTRNATTYGQISTPMGATAMKVSINSTNIATFGASGGMTIGSSYSDSLTTAPSNGLVVQGNVGIGTTSPRAALDVVKGTLLVKPSVSNAGTTIDFSTGNLQHTTNSCQTFTLNNMQDGGSYTFAIKGTTMGTCVFNAYSDVGVTALTVHMPTDHAATVSGKHTLYTFLVMGTDVYVTWIPGL